MLNMRVLQEHIIMNDRDALKYKYKNYLILIVRTWNYGGGSFGRNFSVYINGQILATRCKVETAQRKAIAYINEQEEQKQPER